MKVYNRTMSQHQELTNIILYRLANSRRIFELVNRHRGSPTHILTIMRTTRIPSMALHHLALYHLKTFGWMLEDMSMIIYLKYCPSRVEFCI